MFVSERGPVTGFVFPGECCERAELREDVVPHIDESVGLFGSWPIFFNSDGKFNTIVCGPKEISIGYFGIKVVDDILESLFGDGGVLVLR